MGFEIFGTKHLTGKGHEMDWTTDIDTASTLLHQYSEWLDVEKINPSSPDGRTHDDLVKEFLAQRNPQAQPRVIA